MAFVQGRRLQMARRRYRECVVHSLERHAAVVVLFGLALSAVAVGGAGEGVSSVPVGSPPMCFNVTDIDAYICEHKPFTIDYNSTEISTPYQCDGGDLLGYKVAWFSFTGTGDDMQILVYAEFNFFLAMYTLCDTSDPDVACWEAADCWDFCTYEYINFRSSLGEKYYLLVAGFMQQYGSGYVDLMTPHCWDDLHQKVNVINASMCEPVSFEFAPTEQHLSRVPVPVWERGAEYFYPGVYGQWLWAVGRADFFSLAEAMTSINNSVPEGVDARIVILNLKDPFGTVQGMDEEGPGEREVVKCDEVLGEDILVVLFTTASTSSTENTTVMQVVVADTECDLAVARWNTSSGVWTVSENWMWNRGPWSPEFHTPSELLLIDMCMLHTTWAGGSVPIVTDVSGRFYADALLCGGELRMVRNDTYSSFVCESMLVEGVDMVTRLVGSPEGTIPQQWWFNERLVVRSNFEVTLPDSLYVGSRLVLLEQGNLTLSGGCSGMVTTRLIQSANSTLILHADPLACPEHNYVEMSSPLVVSELRGGLVVVLPENWNVTALMMGVAYDIIRAAKTSVSGFFDAGITVENLPPSLLVSAQWSITGDAISLSFRPANSSAPTHDLCTEDKCRTLTTDVEDPYITSLAALDELMALPSDTCGGLQPGKYGKWFKFRYVPPKIIPTSDLDSEERKLWADWEARRGDSSPDATLDANEFMEVGGPTPFTYIRVSTSYAVTTLDSVVYVFLGNCTAMSTFICQAYDDDSGHAMSSIVHITLGDDGFPDPKKTPWPIRLPFYDYFVLVTGYKDKLGTFGVGVEIDRPEDSSGSVDWTILPNCTCEGAVRIPVPPKSIVQPPCPYPFHPPDPPGFSSSSSLPGSSGSLGSSSTCVPPSWSVQLNGSLGPLNKFEALKQPVPIAFCGVPEEGEYGRGAYGQWFTFRPEFSANVYFDTQGTANFDSILYLYYSREGDEHLNVSACHNVLEMQCLTANDDVGLSHLWSQTSLYEVFEGLDYYVLLTGYAFESGDYFLRANFDASHRTTDDGLAIRFLDGSRNCSEAPTVYPMSRYLSAFWDGQRTIVDGGNDMCNLDPGFLGMWYRMQLEADPNRKDRLVRVQFRASYTAQMDQESAPGLHIFAGPVCESTCCCFADRAVVFRKDGHAPQQQQPAGGVSGGNTHTAVWQLCDAAQLSQLCGPNVNTQRVSTGISRDSRDSGTSRSHWSRFYSKLRAVRAASQSFGGVGGEEELWVGEPDVHSAFPSTVLAAELVANQSYYLLVSALREVDIGPILLDIRGYSVIAESGPALEGRGALGVGLGVGLTTLAGLLWTPCICYVTLCVMCLISGRRWRVQRVRRKENLEVTKYPPIFRPRPFGVRKKKKRRVRYERQEVANVELYAGKGSEMQSYVPSHPLFDRAIGGGDEVEDGGKQAMLQETLERELAEEREMISRAEAEAAAAAGRPVKGEGKRKFKRARKKSADGVGLLADDRDRGMDEAPPLFAIGSAAMGGDSVSGRDEADDSSSDDAGVFVVNASEHFGGKAAGDAPHSGLQGRDDDDPNAAVSVLDFFSS